MESKREPLLSKDESFESYEDCPGCKIDRMKRDNADIPYKNLMFVWIVVLAACKNFLVFDLGVFYDDSYDCY